MPRKTSNKKEDQVKPSAPATTQQADPADLQKKAPQLEYVEGQLVGVQLQDGTVVTLGELPEADLRKMAEDMEIEGAGTLTVEQLVAAIQVEPVQVPAVDAPSSASADLSVDKATLETGPARIASEDGRYQVLLTDGSLAHLEELETDDLVALAGACLRMTRVGLAGAQLIGMDLAGADAVQVIHSTRDGYASRYVVRRDRLDHDDESYSRGEIIQFDDDEHARQLLAIGAIAPEIE